MVSAARLAAKIVFLVIAIILFILGFVMYMELI